MSEQADSKLEVERLSRLLANLKEHIESGQAVICCAVEETPGQEIHLDGKKYLNSFVSFLNAKGLDAKEQISELSLVMELSSYVRHGGVKALIYRLNTGTSQITHDYFDRLSSELCYELDPETLKLVERKSASSFYQRLMEINSVDELLVSKSSSVIDEVLLELVRKLEQVSNDSLVAKALGADT